MTQTLTHTSLTDKRKPEDAFASDCLGSRKDVLAIYIRNPYDTQTVSNVVLAVRDEAPQEVIDDAFYKDGSDDIRMAIWRGIEKETKAWEVWMAHNLGKVQSRISTVIKGSRRF